MLAIKGSSLANKPVLGKPNLIDVSWRGKTQARSLKLWPIGTDTAKHLLYGRMRVTQVGPGYVHTPKGLDATDEHEQMTAARLMPVVVQGRAALRWITPHGQREEAGDCMVYAYAAAAYLGIQTYREPSWARREAKYCPREPDLFSGQTAASPIAASIEGLQKDSATPATATATTPPSPITPKPPPLKINPFAQPRPSNQPRSW